MTDKIVLSPEEKKKISAAISSFKYLIFKYNKTSLQNKNTFEDTVVELNIGQHKPCALAISILSTYNAPDEYFSFFNDPYVREFLNKQLALTSLTLLPDGRLIRFNGVISIMLEYLNQVFAGCEKIASDLFSVIENTWEVVKDSPIKKLHNSTHKENQITDRVRTQLFKKNIFNRRPIVYNTHLFINYHLFELDKQVYSWVKPFDVFFSTLQLALQENRDSQEDVYLYFANQVGKQRYFKDIQFTNNRVYMEIASAVFVDSSPHCCFKDFERIYSLCSDVFDHRRQLNQKYHN